MILTWEQIVPNLELTWEGPERVTRAITPEEFQTRVVAVVIGPQGEDGPQGPQGNDGPPGEYPEVLDGGFF